MVNCGLPAGKPGLPTGKAGFRGSAADARGPYPDEPAAARGPFPGSATVARRLFQCADAFPGRKPAVNSDLSASKSGLPTGFSKLHAPVRRLSWVHDICAPGSGVYRPVNRLIPVETAGSGAGSAAGEWGSGGPEGSKSGEREQGTRQRATMGGE